MSQPVDTKDTPKTEQAQEEVYRLTPNESVARNDPAGNFGIFINHALTLKTNNYG